MGFTLITLCWLTIIVSIFVLISPEAVVRRILPSFILENKKKVLTPVFLIAILITQLNSMFFYAEAGYSYLVQYATGTQTSVLTPGWHLKLYGEVTPMKKVMTVRFTNKDIPASGLDNPIGIRFFNIVDHSGVEEPVPSVEPTAAQPSLVSSD